MSDERGHLQNLRSDYLDRLQILERRAAVYGINTPAEVEIEIKRLRDWIAQIDQRLALLPAQPTTTRNSPVLPPWQPAPASSSRRWWIISAVAGLGLLVLLAVAIQLLRLPLLGASALAPTSAPPSASQPGGAAAPLATSLVAAPELPSAPAATAAPAVPSAQPAPGALIFEDNFDAGLRPEWRKVADGLAVDQGRLTGNDGILLIDPGISDYVVSAKLYGPPMLLFRVSANAAGRITSGYTFECGKFTGCAWHRIDSSNDVRLSGSLSFPDYFAGDVENTLRIQAQGRVLTIWVNDAVLSSISDATYAQGSFGLGGTVPGSSWDAIEIRQLGSATAPSGPFADQFDGALSQAWQTISPGLAVEQGQLAGNEGIMLIDPGASDYVVDTRLFGPPVLLFRISANAAGRIISGYTFDCGKFTGCIWQRIDESSMVDLSGRISFPDYFQGDVENTLKVQVQGSSLTVWVNGQVFSGIGDSTYTTGAFGLGGGVPGSRWDSIAITQLQSGAARVQSGVFEERFDGALSPEWRTLAPGLALDAGRLVGSSGALLIDPQARNYTVSAKLSGPPVLLFHISANAANRIGGGYLFDCGRFTGCFWRRLDPTGAVDLSRHMPFPDAFQGDVDNVIDVQVRDNQFTILLNGTLLSTMSDPLYTSGLFGIGGDAPGSRWDELRIAPSGWQEWGLRQLWRALPCLATLLIILAALIVVRRWWRRSVRPRLYREQRITCSHLAILMPSCWIWMACSIGGSSRCPA